MAVGFALNDVDDQDLSFNPGDIVKLGITSPQDGFRVSGVAGSHDDFLEVRLEFVHETEVAYSCRVWRTPTRLTKDWGEQSRMMAVWRAIASYLNSGGSLELLSGGLETVIGDVDFPLMSISNNSVLFETVQENAPARHLFVDLDTGRAKLWIEDVEIRETSMDDLYRLLAEVPDAQMAELMDLLPPVVTVDASTCHTLN